MTGKVKTRFCVTCSKSTEAQTCPVCGNDTIALVERDVAQEEDFEKIAFGNKGKKTEEEDDMEAALNELLKETKEPAPDGAAPFKQAVADVSDDVDKLRKELDEYKKSHSEVHTNMAKSINAQVDGLNKGIDSVRRVAASGASAPIVPDYSETITRLNKQIGYFETAIKSHSSSIEGFAEQINQLKEEFAQSKRAGTPVPPELKKKFDELGDSIVSQVNSILDDYVTLEDVNTRFRKVYEQVSAIGSTDSDGKPVVMPDLETQQKVVDIEKRVGKMKEILTSFKDYITKHHEAHQKIDKNFEDFDSDISELEKKVETMPRSESSTSNEDYARLDAELKDMAKQLEGVFKVYDEALNNLNSRIDNFMIGPSSGSVQRFVEIYSGIQDTAGIAVGKYYFPRATIAGIYKGSARITLTDANRSTDTVVINAKATPDYAHNCTEIKALRGLIKIPNKMNFKVEVSGQ